MVRKTVSYKLRKLSQDLISLKAQGLNVTNSAVLEDLIMQDIKNNPAVYELVVTQASQNLVAGNISNAVLKAQNAILKNYQDLYDDKTNLNINEVSSQIIKKIDLKKIRRISQSFSMGGKPYYFVSEESKRAFIELIEESFKPFDSKLIQELFKEEFNYLYSFREILNRVSLGEINQTLVFILNALYYSQTGQEIYLSMLDKRVNLLFDKVNQLGNTAWIILNELTLAYDCKYQMQFSPISETLNFIEDYVTNAEKLHPVYFTKYQDLKELFKDQ